MASLNQEPTTLGEVLRLINSLAATPVPPEAQKKVVDLFADRQFMELIQDVSDIAYGKCDADLKQFLGTHAIVPDTEYFILRRIIVAYLIVCKQGDRACAAALDKFTSAYALSASVYRASPSSVRAPDWKLKLLAKEE